MKKRLFLFFCLALAQTALMGLATWQWQRYQERLHAQLLQAQRPDAQLFVSGWQPPLAALTNQPHPVTGQPGWRILAMAIPQPSPTNMIWPLVLVDLGWAPAQAITPPDFSSYQDALPTSATLTGHWLSLPQRRGWLEGPTVTTHPQLLAFLDPSALISGTTAPDYFMLTEPLAGLSTLAQPTPTGLPPQRHLAYALQWALMALILPLLAAYAWRKRCNKH